MGKPTDVFDRDHEWAALERFVDSGTPGATLGLVYGRRRQGKTYLLEALVEERGGLYFAALRQSTAQNLDRLAAEYRRFVSSPAPISFASWQEALEALLALGAEVDQPVLVVLDEFPYLLDGAPELPSLLQALLSPRGRAARNLRVRLILCGSSWSIMRGLLGGSAPLRGRAELELQVHPFGYREAARYWSLDDHLDRAIRLHALVGGTPAYRGMAGGSPPGADLDHWITERLLDPASAMFREGAVLVAEEETIKDPVGYLSILAAIAQGRTRRGEIAAAVGRSVGALAHPLSVLLETRLIMVDEDAYRQKRTTYHLAEPIIRLHQLIIEPNAGRLSRHAAAQVWAEAAETVAAQIEGPHFEEVARTWTNDYAEPGSLGGVPSRVARTVVACKEHRGHEIDIVARSRDGTTLAIGEAKWRSRKLDGSELVRLEHMRSLLPTAGDARLLLFARTGFDSFLIKTAASRPDVELVDLDRLYHGS